MLFVNGKILTILEPSLRQYCNYLQTARVTSQFFSKCAKIRKNQVWKNWLLLELFTQHAETSHITRNLSWCQVVLLRNIICKIGFQHDMRTIASFFV